eukprot:CAMPEP_0203683410 /NCGR_PEP_ID=MMETSP0090-20130426/47507_1 /ASSEMBLY_ACC=CAM_ASM_001088 /TAXON_ID=426623 /ORGANISM="Chaetoceros affinis, Strain CCMP159" /LENGTH=523 /DNA_ID=CAMNT_0050552553 /DNA_START=166 /DNA_END=1737 /DNA_ORIENTATION=-
MSIISANAAARFGLNASASASAASKSTTNTNTIQRSLSTPSCSPATVLEAEIAATSSPFLKSHVCKNTFTNTASTSSSRCSRHYSNTAARSLRAKSISKFNFQKSKSEPKSKSNSPKSKSKSNLQQIISPPLLQDNRQKKVLIIGSSGSLGSTIAAQLKYHHDCVVIGSDIHPPQSQEKVDCIDAYIQLLPLDDDDSNDADSDGGGGNSSSEITIDKIGSDIHPPQSQEKVDCIDAYIQLLPLDDDDDDDGNDADSDGGNDSDGGGGGGNSSSEITIDNLLHGLRSGISNLYNDVGRVEFDAIICTSGGFAMDESVSESGEGEGEGEGEGDKQVVGNVYETMLQMNYYPVVAAGEIVKEHIKTTTKVDRYGNDNGSGSGGGLFIVLGAAAALSPAPGMVAYASSKIAAHYYIQTLGAMTGRALRKEHKIQRMNDVGLDIRRRNDCLDSMTALAILPVMLNTEANRVALLGSSTSTEDCSTWTKPEDIAKEIGAWIDTPAIRPHSGSLVKVVTEDNETEFKLAR